MATVPVLQTLVTLLFAVQLAVLFSLGSGSNFMIGGDVLTAGESLTYKSYNLTLQSDCNLVLKNGTTSIWETMTGGYGSGCYLTLDLNGKLSVWTRYGYAVWTSRTVSQVGTYCLVLRYDGTLHIYGPRLWTSPSSLALPLNTTTGAGLLGWPKTTDSVLYSGDVAPIGTTIANGNNELTLLDDCNLVLTSNGNPVWQTGVTDHTLHDCFVNLEANGEFRVKHWGGDILWSNGVSSPTYAEFVLVLENKYRVMLTIYGPIKWSNSQSSFRKPSVRGIEMVTAD
ncbi:hypothetical protein J5N97_006186 [Dioscorea zingiberensis]|uniref:Bulb-type lectin domain-containing protein n=1 Tax=Dioscorea zingiberensis TaxID=325984 RepID=A0A9D5D9I2_9LILI|nr:hypothetical protein J5N97_006186 [Dioscorea zingiberensis]